MKKKRMKLIKMLSNSLKNKITRIMYIKITAYKIQKYNKARILTKIKLKTKIINIHQTIILVKKIL